MSTKMLLVLSVGLVCVVRIMTLILVAAMNIANVRAHYSLHPTTHQAQDKNQGFYDKAMTVLFDLPNCIVVSTYVLLTLVWAECFLESRFHTESVVQWKKTWLIGYMVFNSVLYATQLVLYTCIFFAHKNNVVRTILYAAITGISFASVLLVLLLYLYVNVRFSVSAENDAMRICERTVCLQPIYISTQIYMHSLYRLYSKKGFPFRSEQSRRSLQRVSSVMTLWSSTRIIWGVATLLVFIYDIELLQDSHTPFWSFVVLLLLFFVCEILPIIAMLDYSYFSTFESRPTDVSFFAESPTAWPVDLLLSWQPLLSEDTGEDEPRVRWQQEPSGDEN
jgi:hypothetical protein